MKAIKLTVLALALAGIAYAQTNASGQASANTAGGATAAGQSASGQADSATSGTASAGKGAMSASAQSQQVLNAQLTKTIDAKKAKEGDQVEAKTTAAFKSASGLEIPKGSKLMGHVTQAKARAKDSKESALGIVFDNAVTKSGQTVPLHAVIVAAAGPVSPAAMDAGAPNDMSSAAGSAGVPAGGSGGGALGGVGQTVGGVANGAGRAVGGVTSDTTSTVGAVGHSGGAVGSATNAGANISGNLQGMPGVMLNTEASNKTSGSVFSSDSQNIKLESGTRLMLQVATQ